MDPRTLLTHRMQDPAWRTAHYAWQSTMQLQVRGYMNDPLAAEAHHEWLPAFIDSCVHVAPFDEREWREWDVWYPRREFEFICQLFPRTGLFGLRHVRVWIERLLGWLCPLGPLMDEGRRGALDALLQLSAEPAAVVPQWQPLHTAEGMTKRPWAACSRDTVMRVVSEAIDAPAYNSDGSLDIYLWAERHAGRTTIKRAQLERVLSAFEAVGGLDLQTATAAQVVEWLTVSCAEETP